MPNNARLELLKTKALPGCRLSSHHHHHQVGQAQGSAKGRTRVLQPLNHRAAAAASAANACRLVFYLSRRFRCCHAHFLHLARRWWHSTRAGDRKPKVEAPGKKLLRI